MIYDKYKFVVPKEKQVRVITNTDAYNEADDQFAIVQTLLSPKLDNVGMIAAHYGIERDSDSMEKSYEEINRIFDAMNLEKEGMIFKGADKPLKDRVTPVDSEGARLIIKEAMSDDTRPLFVTFMGPLTDLASAYLIEPRIASRLTAIWIGGGQYPVGGVEFNLSNDIHAANIVFGSAIPVWQVPKNVYEMMPVSLAELECRVEPCGGIGKYVFNQLIEHSHADIPRKSPFRTGESWVLGDSPAVGLILYEHRFEFDYIPAPQITQDMTYIHTGLNRPIRVYRKIDSRLILEDFYCKLALFARRNNAN
ncbi:nucleoside hydrolase [Sporanaerobium hydrogeniformans]|uniref:Nucleoside hydrolase n=1 Tax=Sporanaerobium hydrogeniformans TaxID=3072179 RepID=A0AC61DCI1_9FIRM|nr:nucleoside hydrolase [Sporanaerobium hydrogeniformans]PHV70451.1 nucleoside hydrolase [Sporanaerobium hydrogeniformans]